MPLDLSPEPIRLRIPDECKPFIVRQRRRNIKMSLLPGLVFIPFFLLVGWKAVRMEFGHLLPIPFSGFVCFYVARKQWRYQIDKRGIFCLIEPSESSWRETEVFWKDRIILSVDESTWEDLPSLSFRMGAKIDSSITYLSVVQMPYRPEDVHTVRDRVMPAIEYYRQKYGHDQWIADHGWESYVTPAKVMVNG
ncbi:MAG TPA: hypothetical protein VFW40_01395 [Capsulimonadaceae bacterium]|nr:hypothetical protein [Capsulimonadaceae bacterium]